ncbi:MAG: hypothetical protein ACR2PL_21215 [Dehalococcoidia bacterium]
MYPSANEEATLASTLFVNLTKDNHADARMVDSEGLTGGARRFWTTIVPVVRPRVIIALTRDVYQHLLRERPSAALRDTLEPGSFVDSRSQNYKLPRAEIHNPDGSYPLLVAIVPNHPSKVNLWLHPSDDSVHRRFYRYLSETAQFGRDLANRSR